MSSRNTNKKKPFAKGKNWTKSRNDKSDSKEVTKDNSKFNDASWYIKEGQLAKDVASLSFNNALGVNYRLNDELSDNPKLSLNSTVPGVLVLNTVPAFGITYDARSPINVAANNIVGFIRSYNSGAKNYDAPDLMLLLGAMDSVYAFIAHLMRAYGTARVFSHTNRYVGDALLYSMGFNGTDVRQHLADFRAYINMMITKASAICTPSIMSIYRRHFWMYSGVYKDEDIEKSQMYLYRPSTLWTYEENEGAGYLKANPVATVVSTTGINNTLWTLAEWEAFGDTMIDKLVTSQDIAVMSGDILKAYGEGNLWKLSLINEDYAVIPVYSEEVLDQIHNTTFCGSQITKGNVATSETASIDITGLDVTQITTGSAPYLMFQPQFKSVGAPAYTRICDLNTENPEPERVMVATRNMVMMKPFAIKDNSTVANVSTCGSDLVLTGSIVSYGTNGSLTSTTFGDRDLSTISYNLMALWNFKRAPLLYRMASNNGGGNLLDIVGAIDNYTTVSFDDLRRMHESALLSMLGVPFYGLQTR